MARSPLFVRKKMKIEEGREGEKRENGVGRVGQGSSRLYLTNPMWEGCEWAWRCLHWHVILSGYTQREREREEVSGFKYRKERLKKQFTWVSISIT